MGVNLGPFPEGPFQFDDVLEVVPAFLRVAGFDRCPFPFPLCLGVFADVGGLDFVPEQDHEEDDADYPGGKYGSDPVRGDNCGDTGDCYGITENPGSHRAW